MNLSPMERELLEREMVSNPVRSLQFMLRRLSLRYPFLPQLQPDGRFGERTLEAVMLFQKHFHPPVTGVVDQGTWLAIRRMWLQTERELSAPRQLRAFPVGEETQVGEGKPYLYVVQSMFRALTRVFEEVEPERIDAIHSGSSVNNTRWLQEKAQLPQTGVMDRKTWDMLARLYELFAVRQPHEKEQIRSALGRG